MGKLTAKANKTFMLGSLLMIVLLFLTVFLFLMWAFHAFDKKADAKYADRYEFVLDKSALDRPMALYVNDSLFFSGTPAAEMTLAIDRFAEESTLLCVDTESDLVTMIPLPAGSATLRITRSGTDFAAE